MLTPFPLGAVILQCDPLALATRLRWRGYVLGVEQSYRLVASTTEPIASVTPPMPGQTMQFALQGVNENLQGVLSDPIQFTIPPVTRVAKPETTAVPMTLETNGNHAHATGGVRRP